MPGAQPHTTNGTRWSGSTPGLRKNPGTLRSRSTRRCYCKPRRGSGSCEEGDPYRKLGGDCQRPANPVPAFQLVTKKDLFRRDETERSVIYLQITNERGQRYASICSGARVVAVGG